MLLLLSLAGGVVGQPAIETDDEGGILISVPVGSSARLQFTGADGKLPFLCMIAVLQHLFPSVFCQFMIGLGLWEVFSNDLTRGGCTDRDEC